MKINENIAKLSGKANIDRELEIGNSYKVVADCEVVKSESLNNQDDTINKIWTLKPITLSIEKDNGEMSKVKDLRSSGTLFKKACWKVWHDKNLQGESDNFYEYAVRRSMGMLDTLAEEYNNK